jgi:oligopeptide transport system substrate-binding protein
MIQTASIRGVLAALAAIAAMALAGCDNSPYSPGLAKQSIYFLAYPDDPRRLDPATSYRDDEQKIVDVICPSYYQYQPLKTQVFQLVPMLGAREALREPYTYTDAEGKTVAGERWTFQIRRDLRFQDDPCFPGGKGRAITAQDFLYAFRRMADPANASPVIAFFADKIVGFGDLIDRNRERQKRGEPPDYDTPVAGLQLDPADPYTFHIALNQPYPQLRYLMAMHFTSPMPHEAPAYYGKDIQRHPVGCGPYMLQEWTPKKRLVLAINPNRVLETFPTQGEPGDAGAGYLALAGKRLPLADKIIIDIITENTTGWNIFLQGYLDSWIVKQDNYQQAFSQQGGLTDEMRRHGIGVVKENELGVIYFAFNMQDPVLGGYTPEKRKLRQAISLAINSQEYIDLFSQGNGLIAQGILPPGIFGYDPDYREPWRKFDPSLTQAKELLKEAGYPDGIDAKTGDRLTIYYDNQYVSAGGRQWVALVTREIQALGIHVESRSQRDVVWQNKIDGDDWQFTDYGWLADYPDPENFFFLLYGPNKRPGPNLTGYNNPAYNALFEKMRAMDDTPERIAIIRQLRTMIEQDCPYIFVENHQTLTLWHDWLAPIKPNPIASNLFKFRQVDGTLRVERQHEWNAPVLWPLALVAGLFVISAVPAARVVRNRHRRHVTHHG